jgi:hypothetical protein
MKKVSSAPKHLCSSPQPLGLRTGFLRSLLRVPRPSRLAMSYHRRWPSPERTRSRLAARACRLPCLTSGLYATGVNGYDTTKASPVMAWRTAAIRGHGCARHDAAGHQRPRFSPDCDASPVVAAHTVAPLGYFAKGSARLHSVPLEVRRDCQASSWPGLSRTWTVCRTCRCIVLADTAQILLQSETIPEAHRET